MNRFLKVLVHFLPGKRLKFYCLLFFQWWNCNGYLTMRCSQCGWCLDHAPTGIAILA